MENNLYICNANNSEMGNLHTTNTAKYSVFSGVTSVIRCGLFAKHIQGVRSLFVHTRKTCYTMRTTNKQARMVKHSNRYARIWKGQVVYFGSIEITRTFTRKADAVAWYEKHQEGWRYNHAVAVVWQGCTSRTPKRHLHDAMLGGAEWQLWKHRGIASQAHCDYLLNSLDYEIL